MFLLTMQKMTEQNQNDIHISINDLANVFQIDSANNWGIQLVISTGKL